MQFFGITLPAVFGRFHTLPPNKLTLIRKCNNGESMFHRFIHYHIPTRKQLKLPDAQVVPFKVLAIVAAEFDFVFTLVNWEYLYFQDFFRFL